MRGESAPADEYFEEFLAEFHRRQREDLMKRSARSLFFERVTVWFRELGGSKWIYGAGLGYAMLMVAFLAWPKGGGEGEQVTPVSWEVPEHKVIHFEPAADEAEPPKNAEF